jgi:UDP-2,3-diacylglucosamine pyrophosphatase LpxH
LATLCYLIKELPSANQSIFTVEFVLVHHFGDCHQIRENLRKETFMPITAKRSFRRPVLEVRTLLISDVHLFNENSKVERAVNLLESIDYETAFHNGDILGGWEMKRKRAWMLSPSHYDYLEVTRTKSQQGAKNVWPVGNHDEDALPLVGRDYFGMLICAEAEFRTLTGLNALVTHGHPFDPQIARLLASLGDSAYELGIHVDKVINERRKARGEEPISISDWCKRRIKRIDRYIGAFRHNAAVHANSRGFDMIACGHDHFGELTFIEAVDIFFVNSGTLVGEPCTAVVETWEGDFLLIYWDDNGYVPAKTVKVSADTLREFARKRHARKRDPELDAVCV